MNLLDIIKSPTATLLDVREPEELINEGEVLGAVLIPMQEIPNKLEELRKMSTPLIIFCRSGVRSEKVVNYLKEQNFKDLYNGGGFQEINKLLKKYK